VGKGLGFELGKRSMAQRAAVREMVRGAGGGR
jgi:hypothetical protein